MHLQREVVAVVGHSGYGKTLWSRDYASHAPRVLVLEGFSDKSEYDTRPIETFSELISFLKSRPPSFRVSYYPVPCFCEKCEGRESQFIHICEAVWAAGGDMLLVVEEAAAYFPRRRVSPQFMHIATKGRHKEISMLLVAQAPSYLPIEIRRESDRLIAFHLGEKNDRDWVKDYPGAGSAVADELSMLPRLEYREIHKDGEVLDGKIEL